MALKSATDSAKPNARRAKVVVRIVLLALAVTWAADTARILWQSWQTALTPVPTCLTELHILNGMRQVADGQDLYPITGQLPLTFHYYNPLTYLPAGLVGGWLDLGFDDLLVVGRLLPLVAGLSLAGLIGIYIWRETRSSWLGCLAVVMLIAFQSCTLTDFFRNRPETPALLCSVAGWIVCQWRPRFWPVLAAVLFVVAIAFKQTFLAAPLACGLQLLLTRQFRPLFALVATSVLLGLGMIGASYYWLGHGYFEHTVWAMQSNPWNPLEGAAKFYPVLAGLHWRWLLPAALVSVVALGLRRQRRPVLLYLTVCLALTSLTHGKQGADLNYHVELSTLMVIATLLGISELYRRSPRLALVPLVLLLCGAWLPMLHYGPAWNNISHNRLLRTYNYAGPPASLANVYAEQLASYRGAALILDEEIAARVGCPVTHDWYALGLFFERGFADFGLLERAVADGRYAVILVPRQALTARPGGGAMDPWIDKLHTKALASGYRAGRHNAEFLELVRG